MPIGYRRYSQDMKDRAVKRLLVRTVSVEELCEETGIGSSTFYRWIQKARNGGMVVKRKDLPPDARSPEEKLRLVVESQALPDTELGEFLRRNGVHEAQLLRWCEAMVRALVESKEPKSSREKQALKELRRELERKDKALAEVTVLLALKKKSSCFGGTRKTTRARGATRHDSADRRSFEGGRSSRSRL